MKILSFINYASSKVLEKFKNDDIVNIGSFYDERLRQKFYKCELGTESYVLALICTMSGLCDFDIGELSAESCLGEEEVGEILDFCSDLDMILLDSNLLYHKDKSIYYLAKKLADKFNSKLLFTYELEEIKLQELDDNNGIILYECLENDEVVISHAVANFAKIKDNSKVIIKTKFKTLTKKVKIDNNLKGLWVLSQKTSGYAFSPCVIEEFFDEN